MTAMTIGSATATVQTASRKALAPQRSVLTRLWNAFLESRMRQAEREIALHRHLLPLQLQQAGDRVTARGEKTLPFAG